MAALSRADLQLRLEDAAGKILSRPQAVSAVERCEAEKIFLSLRTEKSPYELCQYLLEHSQVDFVHFQALTAIREAFLREWETLPLDVGAGLWQYLVRFIMSQQHRLESYVAKETFHVISIIVKRSLVNGKDMLQQTLSVVSDAVQGQLDTQHVGYSLLLALMSEFASTTGPGQRGLSLEYCVQCKKSIEDVEMRNMFSMILQVLEMVVTSATSKCSVNHNLLSLIVELAQVVLTWDFTNRLSTFKGFDSRELYMIPLKPPLSWREIVINPNLIKLFFLLLPVVEDRDSLSHMCLQCLSQLASLTGPALARPSDKAVFVQAYIQELISFMTRPGVRTGTMCSLMAACRRLLDNFSTTQVVSIDKDTLSQFLSLLSRVSVDASKQAALVGDSEASHEGEETFESVSGIWVRLVSETSLFEGEQLGHYIAPVIQAFLKSKLTRPEGWREDCEDTEQFDVGFEDDKTSSHEQLQSISILAREIPFHILPLLVDLVCNRVHRLALVVLGQTDNLPISLNSLFEDLHWLFLVSGHVITNISRDEASVIPQPIMMFSCASSKLLSQQSEGLYQLIKMESPDLVTSYHQQMSGLDPVVALPVAVLQYCHVAGSLVAKGMSDVLSPQVAESALWFLTYWTKAYLGFKESKYDPVSLSLLAVFGEESPLASSMVGYLVELCVTQLAQWCGEDSVSLTVCQLLKVLLAHSRWRTVAMDSPHLWNLLKQLVGFSPPIPSLYPNTQRSLVVALATASSHDNFFSLLMEEYVKYATYAVEMVSKEMNVHNGFLFYLEFLVGLSEGCVPSKVPLLFEYILPTLKGLVPLLKVLVGHSEAILLILQVFSCTADRLLPHLPEDGSRMLFKLSLEVLEMYTLHNAAKYREGSVAEEEQCGDIVECFKILQNLSIKEILDFVDTSEDLLKLSEEVVLHGITILLPLINEQLLQYPSLCTQLCSVVCNICEMHSDSVLLLDRGHFEMLLQVLSIGLLKGGPEVCIDCAKAVHSLSEQCCLLETSPHKGSVLQGLCQFIKVFQMIIESSTNKDITDVCGKTLSSLHHSCEQTDL